MRFGGSSVTLQNGLLRHHNILQDGHVVEQVETLKHHPNLGTIGTQLDIISQNTFAMKKYVAASGSFQKINVPQQR